MAKTAATSNPRKLCERQEDWPRLETLIQQSMIQEWIARRLQAVAQSIAADFTKIEPTLNEICARSCTSCSEPCCMRATVWFDLTDLLLMYLNTGTFPAQQISRNPDGTCSHLTPSGCKVNRINRPFICTWYICAPQKEIINNQRDTALVSDVLESIKVIQSRRKELKLTFLDILAS